MNNINIVEQKYWNNSYDNYKFYIADDVVTQKIDMILEKERKNIKNCFEVGCYPGRYLAHFAKKFSLEANGIDKTNKLNDSFINWLKDNSVEIGNVVCGDAFEYIDKLYKDRIKYDLVYSIGFIEHFLNYKEVIKIQDKILKENGVLIIETPNFRGKIQNIMHKLVDQENLNRHVVEAMNPDEWEKILKEMNYQIITKEYFGGFKFWVDIQNRNILQKILLFIFNKISIFLKNKIKRNNAAYSPYCLLVARKNVL